MLTAGYMNRVPDVIYPLKEEGWYGIWVGVYSPDDLEVRFELRLTGDRFPRTASARRYMYAAYGWIQEEFWKYADLTGQQIVVSKPEKSRAYLVYVKVKPLAEEEVEEVKMDRRQLETKVCGVVCDLSGALGGDGPPYTPDRVQRILDPYIGTDFRKFCWWAMDGERCLYHTRVGTVMGEGQTRFFIPLYKYEAEFMAASLREGWDPLRVAVDYAHEKGLELWINFRMAHTYALGQYDDNFTGRFQMEHQNLRCVDRNGNPNPHLSYAYGEVRAYKTALLKEQAEYGVDGVYLDFTSGPPYVLYEQPLIDGFKREYGEDPRKLSNTLDPRWLRYRSGSMTVFMRGLRKALDEAGQGLGRRIPTAAQVSCEVVFGPDPHCYKIDENLVWGLDLKTWVKEGLIDFMAPSKRWLYVDMPIHYFKNLTEGTECKLWPCIAPVSFSLYPDDYDWLAYFGERKGPAKLWAELDGRRLARLANDLYNQGADGLFLWEGGNPGISTRWHILSRVGHRKELLEEYGMKIGRYDGYPMGIVERDVKFLEE